MTSVLTRNYGLFSDHYLATRLPDQREWDTDYSPLRTRLSALFSEKAGALPTLSEAQTEQQFIRPVLKRIGWKYETQITFRAMGRDYRPDYALFLSDELQRAARSTVSSREEPCDKAYMGKVAALAEAKYWDRPLEERRAVDARDRRPDRGRSPHFQIIDYLRDSGVRWGILTNGRTWRLYLTGTETSEILYYEADLGGILESGDSDEFKRFCLFFRAEAFAPDETGRCFLDRLRQESQQYATQVEDSLKERVFDSVVPAIAEGFLQNLREDKGVEVGPDDRETLDRIYGGTLLLLYRLFFLLYAEARDLIAVGDDAGYRAKSLQHLKEEVFNAFKNGVSLGATSTDWWDDLRNLFRIINRGDSGLSVPRYNGGLFAPDGLGDPDIRPAAEFLEENAIADRSVAEALMLLTRHGEAEGDYTRPEFIDFRDLGVRHLGSVYEGLLEFKLNIADTHLVKASEKGKPVWKPADDPAKAGKKPGELYLTNDKSERKATGSYYTPDYIVRYIVENTVGPQIDRIEREYELAQEIGSKKGERRPWDEILGEVLAGKPADEAGAARELWNDLKSDAERRQFLLNQLQSVQPEHGYDPPTRVLELTVLDPALGSGHFLVGALDYITTRLAAMLNKYRRSPVFERIRDDRRKIVQSLKKQGIEADEGKLTDENLLRRMVMKRCLYGVDLNPLAVELSKLSLWLHAFTAGAPLSFLDHHVKCGNSLIGSTLDKLRQEVRKAGGLWRLPLGPLQRAVQHMLTVAELSDASFEDVERSREEYWKADARVEGYRAMLDSLTAVHFGLKEAINVIEFGHDIDLERYQESLAGMDPKWRGILEKARRIARERRFFHWEVEFPEVFFERRGQGVDEKPDAGFDAVVGNPPYGRVRDEDYCSVVYDSVTGNQDNYAVFLERALKETAKHGHVGYIVPVTWQTGLAYGSLRRVLDENAMPTVLVNLPFDVFREAYVDTCIAIFLVQPEPVQKQSLTVFAYQFPKRADAEHLPPPAANGPSTPAPGIPTRERRVPYSQLRTASGEFIVDARSRATVNAMRPRLSVPLGELTGSARGILPRPDQLTADKVTESHKPFFTGDIRRYGIADGERSYVEYSDRLRERPDDYSFFRGERVLVRRLVNRQDRLMAANATDELVVKKDLYVFKARTQQYRCRYLLSLLNSGFLAAYYLAGDVAAQKDDFRQTTLEGLRTLPIRRIFFTTPQQAREAKREKLVAAYETEDGSFAEILRNLQGLLLRNEDGEFAAFADSISMGEALKRGYVEEIPDYLDEDVPSGYDADGYPLEHSDVVHDFLAYLAEQMMDMHREKQALWEKVRAAFLNCGVDPKDLSSLSVTKSIRDYVAKSRQKSSQTARQRRMLTYAEQAERAFGCSLEEVHESGGHNYRFDDLPRLGFKQFKWLAALRGADPALLDKVRAAISEDLGKLRDVLERIGSGDWYPHRDPERGEYDVANICSTDWLIDQIVYRLYGLTDEQIRLVEQG